MESFRNAVHMRSGGCATPAHDVRRTRVIKMHGCTQYQNSAQGSLLTAVAGLYQLAICFLQHVTDLFNRARTIPPKTLRVVLNKMVLHGVQECVLAVHTS